MRRIGFVTFLACTLVATPTCVRAQPTDPRVAARTAIHQSFESVDADSTDRYVTEAIRQGRIAVARLPDDAEAHYWLAAALGRRAIRRGGIRPALECYREARHALALDSLHAGAHAIVARFNEEVSGFPWSLRLLLATATGIGDIRRASVALAEREYRTAVRLDPGSLQYRNDLGRFLANAGRIPEAEEQWRIARTLPDRAPVDDWLRRDLRRRIDEAARHR
jgi:tetratricopeptide (TPR) repeat protein